MVIAIAILSTLLAGSLVYCVLVMTAARRYLAAPLPPAGKPSSISVIKPLCGCDEGLEENLRSFFAQDYPDFEVLLAVHRENDTAVGVAEKVIGEFAGRIPARLIVTGESPIPNAKSYSLNRLVREARHELLVMGDSDVRVRPDLLKHLAREFEEPCVGLITCPYRAIGARSTRRSGPAGYWGQIFTYPLPLALLLWATDGAAWPAVLLALVLRIGAAVATSESVLHDPVLRREWWLLPIQDVLGFLVWIGGFLGDTIIWRDRKCTVLRDGRLQVNS